MRRILFLCLALLVAAVNTPRAYAQYPGGQSPAGRAVSGQSPAAAAGTRPQGRIFHPPRSEVKPEKAAAKAYNAAMKIHGTRRMNSKMSLPKRPTPTRKPSAQTKLDDTYGRALEQFTEVLRNKNDMYEAWNQVGFIHLRFGAFRESIDDYNHALALKPDLQEAIEHRGEAYMGADRLDEAKAAYMDLFFHARPLGGSIDGHRCSPGCKSTEPRQMACALRISTPSTNGCRSATASPRRTACELDLDTASEASVRQRVDRRAQLLDLLLERATR